MVRLIRIAWAEFHIRLLKNKLLDLLNYIEIVEGLLMKYEEKLRQLKEDT